VASNNLGLVVGVDSNVRYLHVINSRHGNSCHLFPSGTVRFLTRALQAYGDGGGVVGGVDGIGLRILIQILVRGGACYIQRN
jgi:hypothetical protein